MKNKINYMTLYMSLGMCFGVSVGLSYDTQIKSILVIFN